jgi:hypothetical protein
MKKNIHDTHTVAIFARKHLRTDEVTWVLRLSRFDDKTPESEAVQFKWRHAQQWFADRAEMELFIATMKAGRKLLIRSDRVIDLIRFLEEIEPAAVTKGSSIPVHSEESAEVI